MVSPLRWRKNLWPFSMFSFRDSSANRRLVVALGIFLDRRPHRRLQCLFGCQQIKNPGRLRHWPGAGRTELAAIRRPYRPGGGRQARASTLIRLLVNGKRVLSRASKPDARHFGVPLGAAQRPQTAVEMKLAFLRAFNHRREIPASPAHKMLFGLGLNDSERHGRQLPAQDLAGVRPKRRGHAEFMP